MPDRRDIRLFDRDRPLVMARHATLFHFDVAPGDPLIIVDGPIDDESAKGELTEGDAQRLWLTGQADYVVDAVKYLPWPENADVQMTETGGGWYRITAPWMTDDVKVRGEDLAKEQRQLIEDRGDTKGVTITPEGGGWFTITAPWLDDPEKIQGQADAEARYSRLIADGPPEGWVFMTDDEKATARELEAQRQQDAADLIEANRIVADQIEQARINDEREAAERERVRIEAEQAEAQRIADDAAAREREAAGATGDLIDPLNADQAAPSGDRLAEGTDMIDAANGTGSGDGPEGNKSGDPGAGDEANAALQQQAIDTASGSASPAAQEAPTDPVEAAKISDQPTSTAARKAKTKNGAKR